MTDSPDPTALPSVRAGAAVPVPSIAAVMAMGAAVLLPPAAAAQAAPVHLEFGVQGGVLSPAGELASGAGVADGELELSDAFALGGHAGLQMPGGWMAEAAVVTSPGTEAEGDGASTGASFLAATGHLVFRFPIPLLEPFLGAGAGIRRLSFDDRTALGTDGASDLAGVLLGGGYVTAVPGWRIRLEARNVISGFEDPRSGESDLQNHVLFLVGLSWRIP